MNFWGKRIKPIEFDCEGCGNHVYAFGITAIPNDRFCATCSWCHDLYREGKVTLVEFWELYMFASDHPEA